MAWRIKFEDSALKEMAKLDHKHAKRIMAFLRERIASAEDPRHTGEPLKGPRLGNFWRYRVGDYRIVCKIEDLDITVFVLRVGHRREVYR